MLDSVFTFSSSSSSSDEPLRFTVVYFRRFGRLILRPPPTFVAGFAFGVLCGCSSHSSSVSLSSGSLALGLTDPHLVRRLTRLQSVLLLQSLFLSLPLLLLVVAVVADLC